MDAPPVLIVGGGAAGIAAAYNLIVRRDYPANSVVVLESSDRWGGRAYLDSIETATGQQVAIEAGAGRVADRLIQPALWSIIDELNEWYYGRDLPGIETVPASESVDPEGKAWFVRVCPENDSNDYELNDGGRVLTEIAQRALARASADPDFACALERMSWLDYLRKNAEENGTSADDAVDLTYKFGFFGDFKYNCAMQAARAFAYGGFASGSQLTYWTVKGGMQRIVEAMVERIESESEATRLHRNVLFRGLTPEGHPDIDYNGPALGTHGDLADIRRTRFSRIILAIPPAAALYLKNVFASASQDLIDATLHPLPMTRIYTLSRPDPVTGRYWWSPSNSSADIRIPGDPVAVNSTGPLGISVFYTTTNGDERLALVSYCDGERAQFWDRLGDEELVEELTRAITQTFEYAETRLPAIESQNIKRFHWENGSHVWRPLCDDSDFKSVNEVANFITSELPLAQPGFHVVLAGEAYAVDGKQQWMEGAVVTALSAVEQVLM